MKKGMLLMFLGLAFIFQCINALNDMPLIAQFQGEHNNSGYGNTMVSLDFNHDGYDDLIVYSAFYGYQYQQTPSRGKVYVYYGGPSFSSTTVPAMTLEGDYPEGMQRKIGLIVNIGDVNGDGFEDLMIGDSIPNISSSERYMYYFGGTSDLSTPDRILLPNGSEIIHWIAKLGDVDGDGFSDVGIFYQIGNVSGFDIQWGGSNNRQEIHSDSGIASYPNAITGIGDINVDGYDDIAVGYAIGGNNISNYTVTVYLGNPDRMFVSPWVLVFTTYQITCISKSLGDLNGDGYADFLGYVDYQGLKLWNGTYGISSSVPDVILNPLYFGDAYVEGIEVGDINGDGYDDVVGASYNNQRFAVWMGSSTMNGQADWIKFNQYENFGYDLAMGDYNGDGLCDIAVSAPFEDGSWPLHDYRGYVFIYAGNAQMVATEDETIPHPNIINWGIEIYPNPVNPKSQLLNVKLTGTGYQKTYELCLDTYNIKGQKLVSLPVSPSQISKGELELQLPDTAQGVYIVAVKSGSRILATKRIIRF